MTEGVVSDEDFEAAVQKAVDFFDAERRLDHEIRRQGLEQDLAMRVFYPPLPMRRHEFGYATASYLQNNGYKRLRSDPAELIEASRSRWTDFESLKLGIALTLHLQEHLPDEAQVWLVYFLSGQVQPPKGRRKGPYDRLDQKLWIYVMVEVLARPPMKPTRGSESPQKSACDAVAVARARLNLPTNTFDAVKSIWDELVKKRDAQGNVSLDIAEYVKSRTET